MWFFSILQAMWSRGRTCAAIVMLASRLCANWKVMPRSIKSADVMLPHICLPAKRPVPARYGNTACANIIFTCVDRKVVTTNTESNSDCMYYDGNGDVSMADGSTKNRRSWVGGGVVSWKGWWSKIKNRRSRAGGALPPLASTRKGNADVSIVSIQ
jgi:hypothetical protein